MGAKPHKAFQADRPESGGSDKDMIREKTGLREIQKQQVAQSMASASEQAASAAESAGKTGLQNGVETPENTK